MTTGKLLLLILIVFISIFVIGELLYRYKRWRLEKEKHLPIYGCGQSLERSDYYLVVFIVYMIILFSVYIISTIVKYWNVSL